VGPTTNFKPVAVALVAIAFWLSSAGPLNALPSPEQHEMSGTVQRVDRQAITILPAGESKPVAFEWNKDTKFLRNRAFTSVDAVRPGVQVTIRCSHPILGPPRLYRVAWQTNTETNSASITGEHDYNLPFPIVSREQAEGLKPGAKIAMACTKCKTVRVRDVDFNRGILEWFTPNLKHVCPGCGGHWSYVVYGKGSRHGGWIHTCSKCGDKSIFCCSTEPGKKTKAM